MEWVRNVAFRCVPCIPSHSSREEKYSEAGRKAGKKEGSRRSQSCFLSVQEALACCWRPPRACALSIRRHRSPQPWHEAGATKVAWCSVVFRVARHCCDEAACVEACVQLSRARGIRPDHAPTVTDRHRAVGRILCCGVLEDERETLEGGRILWHRPYCPKNCVSTCVFGGECMSSSPGQWWIKLIQASRVCSSWWFVLTASGYARKLLGRV